MEHGKVGEKRKSVYRNEAEVGIAPLGGLDVCGNNHIGGQ